MLRLFTCIKWKWILTHLYILLNNSLWHVNTYRFGRMKNARRSEYPEHYSLGFNWKEKKKKKQKKKTLSLSPWITFHMFILKCDCRVFSVSAADLEVWAVFVLDFLDKFVFCHRKNTASTLIYGGWCDGNRFLFFYKVQWDNSIKCTFCFEEVAELNAAMDWLNHSIRSR